MTIQEVKEILKGNFADPKDREYWQRKLKELEQKERTAKDNEEYYRKMARYNR